MREWSGLVGRVVEALAAEREAQPRPGAGWAEGEALAGAQRRVRAALREVGRSGDLEAILEAERAVLDNEHEHYAPVGALREGLNAACLEVGVALDLARLVRDRAAYRGIAAAHRLPQNRVDGLPRDEARQFFEGYGAHLIDHAREVESAAERGVIEQRELNIEAAEQLYAELQAAAVRDEVG